MILNTYIFRHKSCNLLYLEQSLQPFLDRLKILMDEKALGMAHCIIDKCCEDFSEAMVHPYLEMVDRCRNAFLSKGVAWRSLVQHLSKTDTDLYACLKSDALPSEFNVFVFLICTYFRLKEKALMVRSSGMQNP